MACSSISRRVRRGVFLRVKEAPFVCFVYTLSVLMVRIGIFVFKTLFLLPDS